MESIETSQVVTRLDDYRSGVSTTPPGASYDPAAERRKLLIELSALSDCILRAAEILSRIKVPRS